MRRSRCCGQLLLCFRNHGSASALYLYILGGGSDVVGKPHALERFVLFVLVQDYQLIALLATVAGGKRTTDEVFVKRLTLHK